MLFYLQWFAVTWHQWFRTNWSNCPRTDGRFPGKRIFSVCRQFLQFCKACHASFKAENIHLWNSPWWSQGKSQRYCKKKSWRKQNLCGKGVIMLFVSGMIKATCWPFLINTVLKWSQYPTNVGSSPSSPTLFVITIMTSQE